MWAKMIGKRRPTAKTQYVYDRDGNRHTGYSDIGYAIRKGKEDEYWKKKIQAKIKGARAAVAKWNKPKAAGLRRKRRR